MSQAFYLPTRVFSGSDCLKTHAAALKLGTKALIVTGRRSAVTTGAGADAAAALDSQGIAHLLYDKIPPNPGFAEVREAAALARAEGVDFIVGIGGGSPLDAAKVIAVLAVNDLTDDQLLAPPFARAPLPIAAVPTTAGTGSEVTPYAILTNDRIQSKSNIGHESIFPRLAFLDARYTEALPRHVTVNTALDAMSHLVEGFLAVRGTAFSSSLALQGLRQLGPALKALAAGGVPGLPLRESLLLTSTTAGMVISHSGTTAVHALGYSLTYFKNIDHGRANALTMAEYLAFVRSGHAGRVDEVLAALGLADLDALKRLLDTLLGPRETLTDDEITKFAAIAVKARNMANTLTTPTENDLAGLYRRSFQQSR
jgi:alcohol dehydrogenase class IV